MDLVNSAVSALSTVVGILKTAFELLSGAVGGNANAIKVLIGIYAGWKVLTFAGKITQLAGSFGSLSKKQDAARGSAGRLNASLAGKAGLAVGVAAASWEVSKMIRKIPGWDKKMKEFGAGIHDVLADIGLIKDPMKQFEGKANPTQQLIGGIRGRAQQLERGGMTPKQAADQLARQFPNVARHDIDVAAGVTAKAAGVTIGTQNNHFHGVQNPRQMEDELAKRHKQRPHRRRGT
jgi:hypothetical protein